MNITNPKLLYLKAALFILTGVTSAAIIFAQNPTLKTAALLVIAIWSFARAYYFAFYVVQNYVDPSFKFSGLWAFFRCLTSRK